MLGLIPIRLWHPFHGSESGGEGSRERGARHGQVEGRRMRQQEGATEESAGWRGSKQCPMNSQPHNGCARLASHQEARGSCQLVSVTMQSSRGMFRVAVENTELSRKTKNEILKRFLFVLRTRMIFELLNSVHAFSVCWSSVQFHFESLSQPWLNQLSARG